MKSTLITGAAITAALVVVLFDRVIVPSLGLCLPCNRGKLCSRRASRTNGFARIG